MHIVVASVFPEKLAPALKRHDDIVRFVVDSKDSLDWVERTHVELIVAFGYGKIFPKALLKTTRVVNLHGGLLPWNRGPNPNLWSWIDDTPKGVSIHEVDSGVDTGPVIAQSHLAMKAAEESLQSSYDRVVLALVSLFDEWWPRIREQSYQPMRQTGMGTKHTLQDQAPFQKLIEENLDMALPEFLELIKPFTTGRGKRAADH